MKPHPFIRLLALLLIPAMLQQPATAYFEYRILNRNNLFDIRNRQTSGGPSGSLADPIFGSHPSPFTSQALAAVPLWWMHTFRQRLDFRRKVQAPIALAAAGSGEGVFGVLSEPPSPEKPSSRRWVLAVAIVGSALFLALAPAYQIWVDSWAHGSPRLMVLALELISLGSKLGGSILADLYQGRKPSVRRILRQQGVAAAFGALVEGPWYELVLRLFVPGHGLWVAAGRASLDQIASLLLLDAVNIFLLEWFVQRNSWAPAYQEVRQKAIPFYRKSARGWFITVLLANLVQRPIINFAILNVGMMLWDFRLYKTNGTLVQEEPKGWAPLARGWGAMQRLQDKPRFRSFQLSVLALAPIVSLGWLAYPILVNPSLWKWIGIAGFTWLPAMAHMYAAKGTGSEKWRSKFRRRIKAAATDWQKKNLMPHPEAFVKVMDDMAEQVSDVLSVSRPLGGGQEKAWLKHRESLKLLGKLLKGWTNPSSAQEISLIEMRFGSHKTESGDRVKDPNVQHWLLKMADKKGPAMIHVVTRTDPEAPRAKISIYSFKSCPQLLVQFRFGWDRIFNQPHIDASHAGSTEENWQEHVPLKAWETVENGLRWVKELSSRTSQFQKGDAPVKSNSFFQRIRFPQLLTLVWLLVTTWNTPSVFIPLRSAA